MDVQRQRLRSNAARRIGLRGLHRAAGPEGHISGEKNLHPGAVIETNLSRQAGHGEILMAKIPQQRQRTQMGLFDEHQRGPNWRDFGEATRVEAVRMLSRLLLKVRAGRATRSAQNGESR